MRTLVRLSPLVLTLALALPAAAQTADADAIKATALDYGEGWYEGNADRMARAVHPELVKRIVVFDSATGKSMIQGMGSSVLVNSTRRGFGKNTPANRQEKTVQVLDIFQNTAVARLTMADWIDYLQLAKIDGRWVIINVLWERKAGPGH